MMASVLQGAVLASHMTRGLEARALLTLVLLVTGLLIVVSAMMGNRRGRRRTILLVGVSLLAVGGLSGANVSMRHHIHLCHEHSDDSCGPGHRATGGADHRHLFGRW